MIEMISNVKVMNEASKLQTIRYSPKIMYICFFSSDIYCCIIFNGWYNFAVYINIIKQLLHQIYPKKRFLISKTAENNFHIKFHAVWHDEHQLDDMTSDFPNLNRYCDTYRYQKRSKLLWVSFPNHLYFHIIQYSLCVQLAEMFADYTQRSPGWHHHTHKWQLDIWSVLSSLLLAPWLNQRQDDAPI